MKRWTNGLPGATKRLGAKMALRGLAASQPRMRADTHDGPEQIAPLQRPDTLMQLSRSLISEVHLVPHGRAIHLARSGHIEASSRCPLSGGLCCKTIFARPSARLTLWQRVRRSIGPGSANPAKLTRKKPAKTRCLVLLSALSSHFCL